MSKLTIFHLPGCPYCRKARQALEELDTSGVEIEWIDESANAAEAEKYDYYYVPAVFRGGEKLFEAKPADTYETIREGLRASIAAAR